MTLKRGIVQKTFDPKFTDLHSSTKEMQLQKSCISFIREECTGCCNKANYESLEVPFQTKNQTPFSELMPPEITVAPLTFWNASSDILTSDMNSEKISQFSEIIPEMALPGLHSRWPSAISARREWNSLSNALQQSTMLKLTSILSVCLSGFARTTLDTR